MRKVKKAEFVDGLATVRAVKRVRSKKNENKSENTKASHPVTISETHKKSNSAKPKIKTTIVPEKHSIVCYHCLFSFFITGKLQNNFCPRCKQLLIADNINISSDWEGVIRTIGNVNIASNLNLLRGSITAGNLYLYSDASRIELYVTGSLHLYNNANFDPEKSHFNELVIEKDCCVSFNKPLKCNILTVYGIINGNINCDRVTLCSTSKISGTLHTKSISIEEGASISAYFYVKNIVSEDTLTNT